MIRVGCLWYMFFEVKNGLTNRGEIAVATSPNGTDWSYGRIVHSEPFHLSYPYVFSWQGEFYMIPETLQPGEVRLYRAREFPTGWEYLTRLTTGTSADSSIVYHGGLWWLFTCARPWKCDRLRLYYAEGLTGPWYEHSRSPIVNRDPIRGRPGGRVIEWNDRLIRYSQNCAESYGKEVRAFEILTIDRSEYVDREYPGNPVLAPTGTGWNGTRMHTIDPHELEDGTWIACVDGSAGQGGLLP